MQTVPDPLPLGTIRCDYAKLNVFSTYISVIMLALSMSHFKVVDAKDAHTKKGGGKAHIFTKTCFGSFFFFAF